MLSSVSEAKFKSEILSEAEIDPIIIKNIKINDNVQTALLNIKNPPINGEDLEKMINSFNQ